MVLINKLYIIQIGTTLLLCVFVLFYSFQFKDIHKKDCKCNMQDNQ